MAHLHVIENNHVKLFWNPSKIVEVKVLSNSDRQTMVRTDARTHARTTPNCHCDIYVSLTASGLNKNSSFSWIMLLFHGDFAHFMAIAEFSSHSMGFYLCWCTRQSRGHQGKLLSAHSPLPFLFFIRGPLQLPPKPKSQLNPSKNFFFYSNKIQK